MVAHNCALPSASPHKLGGLSGCGRAVFVRGAARRLLEHTAKLIRPLPMARGVCEVSLRASFVRDLSEAAVRSLCKTTFASAFLGSELRNATCKAFGEMK